MNYDSIELNFTSYQLEFFYARVWLDLLTGWRYGL